MKRKGEGCSTEGRARMRLSSKSFQEERADLTKE